MGLARGGSSVSTTSASTTRNTIFDGMSAEEIQDAQGPLGGWEQPSRKFAANGADRRLLERFFRSARCDLDALRAHPCRRPSRFTKSERRALSVLGLGEDSDRHQLRKRYSGLVRRYHPDKNGGDRSHEGKLGAVIEAYQLLRKSAAFA